MKKLMALLLSLTLLLGTLPMAALAADGGEEVSSQETMIETVLETVTLEDDPLADYSNDDLFALYVDSLFYPEKVPSSYSTGNNTAGNKLSGMSKTVYDYLVTQIIGDGSTGIAYKGGPTEFTVDTYTYTEAGIDESDQAETYDAFKTNADTAIKDHYSTLDVGTVVRALMLDYPYEMFWYDKTETGGVESVHSTEYGGQTTITGDTSGYIKGTGTATSTYKVTMYVAAGYSSDGTTTKTTTVDSEKISSVSTAVAKADAIVDGASEKETNFEKLKYFMEQICDLTSYNDEAVAEGSTTAYGDPWQMIYVFDGDGEDDTKVVCEGYAKAFQYLCDKAFASDSSVQCYTVTGTMTGGTGAGNHMWNIVTLDESNYLVDVTNCDEGSVGNPDYLFLRGATGSVDSGYSFTIPEHTVSNGTTVETTITYTYGTDLIWDSDVLTLSTVDHPAYKVSTVAVSPATSTLTLDVSGTASATFTATAKDGSGNAVTDEKFTWSLSRTDDDSNTLEASGLTISDGVVSVTDASKVAKWATVEGVAVTVTATCGGVSGTATLKVMRQTAAATTITGTANPTTVNISSDTNPTVKLSATVLDQYGIAMSDQDVTVSWVCDNSNVSIEGSTATISYKITNGTILTFTPSVTDAATDAKVTDATVTVSRDASTPEEITIKDPTEDVELIVPARGDNPATVTFTAEVKDQYGEIIGNPGVAWSLSDSGNGVSIDSNGTVTVAYDKTLAEKLSEINNRSKTYTVTATSTIDSSVYKTAMLTVKLDVATAKTIKIYSDAEYETEITSVVMGIPANSTDDPISRTFYAQVLDQYGLEMDSETVEWSSSDTDNVSVTYGTVSVKSGATAGTPVTITAKVSDTVCATLTVTPKEITVTDWPEPTAITYGATLASAFALPASGEATIGGTKVSGTFSVQDSTKVPGAGSYTATVVFTVSSSDTNGYAGVTISNEREVTVKPAELTVTWSGPVTNGSNTVVYDGKEKSVTATVTGVVNGDDAPYTVSGDTSKTNAGSYTATLTLNSDVTNYTLADSSQATYAWSITPATVTVAWSNLTVTYNGSAQAPTATADGVTLTVTLTKDGSSSNTATDAGTYTATATLDTTIAGNYTLSGDKATFTISKATRDPSEASVSATIKNTSGSTQTVDLSDYKPETSATYAVTGNYTGLASATMNDDTLTLTANGSIATTDVGTVTDSVTVTISSTNYTDVKVTVTVSYTDKETVTIKYNGDTLDTTYTGSAYVGLETPSLSYTDSSNKTVTLSNPTIDITYEGTGSTSYGSSETAPMDAGTYQAVVNVTGTADNGTTYVGSVTLPFTISPKSLSDGMIQPIDDETYTGSAIEPAVTVKDGETELKAGTDYTAEYSNNTDVGTATVTITGTGNYTGTKTTTFTINQATRVITVASTTKSMTVGDSCTVASLLSDNAKNDDPTYTVTIEPENSVVTLSEGTITAAAAGTATVTFTNPAATKNYAAYSGDALTVTITVTAASTETPSTEPETETPVEEEPTVETPDEVETPESTSTATPEVTVDEETEAVLTEAGLTADDITELTDSLSTVTVANEETGKDVLSEELASADNTDTVSDLLESVDDKQKEDAVSDLADIGITVASASEVAAVVITYMDITVTNYVAGTDNASPVLSMEIAPMIMVALTDAATATTASNSADYKIETSGNNQNAVALEGTATPLTITKPVTISVQLPSFFADQVVNNTVYVGHKTNGRSYQYRGGLNGSVLTFTNPHGFSPFEFTTEPSSAAWIGDVGYESLSAALDEVQNGETIIVTDGSTSGSADRTDLNGKTFSIVSSDGTTPWSGTLTINGKAQTVGTDGKVTVSTGSSSGSSSSSGGSGSGSSSSSGSTVSVNSATGGRVTVSPSNASKGATVTLTVKPSSGYELSSLVVKDKDGNEIDLTEVSDTKYTFTMPSGKVTVTPTFVKISDETPGDTTPTVTSPFTDVPSSAYYYDAIQWAVDEGITTGKTATTFDPDGSCTRAQMVTFLWRYAGEPEPESTSNPFIDISESAYYYKAVLWAVEQGITNGYDDGTFRPDNTVTRAQTVTFLYRYANEPEVDSSNSFTDVENGKYFTDAIQWAVANNVTTGYNDSTFRPYNNCTRAQIVTFMYRDFA